MLNKDGEHGKHSPCLQPRTFFSMSCWNFTPEITKRTITLQYVSSGHVALHRFCCCCGALAQITYYIAHYNSQCHIERININGVKPATGDGAPQTAKSLLWPSQLWPFLLAKPAGLLLNVDWLAALRRLPEWSTGGAYGENRPLFLLSPSPTSPPHLPHIATQLRTHTHTHKHLNIETRKQSLFCLVCFCLFKVQRRSDEVKINWRMHICSKNR